MSVTFVPKRGNSPPQKKAAIEGYVHAFLARQRERELPTLVKFQSYRNVFFDWYFFIASVLGEELFFISFIPFCCWNVSRQVALHLTFLLALAVGGGNMLKNLLQSPRPSPKSIWVNKSSPEADPGFPSTHTMTAFTIPWYLIIFYWESMTTPTLMVSVAVLCWWSLSIAVSRVYNGHHFIIDVMGGLFLAIAILFIWSQYLRYIIDPVISDPSIYIPVVVIGVAVGLLCIHPIASSANPAAAETGLVFGTCSGTALAIWLHHYGQFTTGMGYQLANAMVLFSDVLALLAARFVIGAVLVAIAREISKKTYLPLLLFCHSKYVDFNSSTSMPASNNTLVSPKKMMVYNKTNYKHSGVDVALKFITYTIVSFTVTAIVPHVCCMLGLFHVSDLVVFVK